MKDLRTYVLETKKISSIDDYVLEGFKLGKNKIDKEDDIVDLDLPSGTLWCKYNVGAKPGSTPESWYGDYFMWGDIEPATNKRCVWANYKYINDKLTKYCPFDEPAFWDGKGKPDNKLVLNKEDDMAAANMKGDWKMPTKEQLQELLDNTTNEWVKDYNDIHELNGRVFTSKTNGNTLFIPAAGYRIGSSVHTVGFMAYVWSSTLDDRYPHYAHILVGDSYRIHTSKEWRNSEFSVRAIMNKK